MKPTPMLLAGAAAIALATTAASARELTFGLQDSEVSTVYLGAKEFQERLADLSGGESTVELFPSAQLGGFKAMVAQAQAGEHDALANELTLEAEDDLLAAFEERGLTITRPDLQPFRAAMQPYYDTIEAEFGAGVIAEVIGEYPRDARQNASQIATLFVKSFPALFTPVVIFGGIFSGLFSPTEAAAITVLYAIVIDLVFYRELTVRRLWDAIYETSVTSAWIATIIAEIGLLGFVLAREQAPQQIAQLFLTIADGPLSFLIAVNLMIFALGCFIE